MGLSAVADRLLKGVAKKATSAVAADSKQVVQAADKAAEGLAASGRAAGGKLAGDSLELSSKAVATLAGAARALPDPPAGAALDAATAAAAGRMPAPATRTGEWLTVANHLHTTPYSPDANEPEADLIQRLEKAGVDGMILTDHNSMGGTLTPEWQAAESKLIMTPGMEWGALRETGMTVQGHAGLIGLTGTTNIPTNATIDEMIPFAKARNAFIVANHPYLDGNAWATRPVLQPEVGGVEVWNGQWALSDPISHNAQALSWWDSMLKQGRHLTAVGGSDFHGDWWTKFPRLPGSSPVKPVDLLFASEHSPEGVKQAIADGLVSVESSDTAAKIVLEADPKHDGSWSAIQGDDINVAQDGTIPMRAHVLGGKGLTVEFYGKAGQVGSYPVMTDDAYVPYSAVGVPNVKDYVRAELKQHPGQWWSMTALTNPIYVN